MLEQIKPWQNHLPVARVALNDRNVEGNNFETFGCQDNGFAGARR
jgi:hypothetical protein